MSVLVWFVVYALAVARITGLVTTDEITSAPRDSILRRLRDTSAAHRALATLITCQWCASIWIAAATAPLAWWHPASPWVGIPALALAASQVTGLLSRIGRT